MKKVDLRSYSMKMSIKLRGLYNQTKITQGTKFDFFWHESRYSNSILSQKDLSQITQWNLLGLGGENSFLEC